MKRFLLVSSINLAVWSVGCGGAAEIIPEINVEADVNGTTGAELTEAFFGIATQEDQPLLQAEDLDNDGNVDIDEDLDSDFNIDINEDLNANGLLDPGEDVDGDGRLDLVAEDLDGDGRLDFFNEDLDGNGVLNDVPVDINQDGVLDENDNATVGLFILVASGGGVSCEDFTASFIDQGPLPVNDTIFFVFGAQASLGPSIASEFVAGNTVAVRDLEGDIVGLQTAFGQIVNGEADPLNSGIDDQSTILKFDALGETLDATITANLVGPNDEIFPLFSTVKNIAPCAPLSEGLAAQIARGNLFN